MIAERSDCFYFNLLLFLRPNCLVDLHDRVFWFMGWTGVTSAFSLTTLGLGTKALRCILVTWSCTKLWCNSLHSLVPRSHGSKTKAEPLGDVIFYMEAGVAVTELVFSTRYKIVISKGYWLVSLASAAIFLTNRAEIVLILSLIVPLFCYTRSK
jgi:hypothetical protein